MYCYRIILVSLLFSVGSACPPPVSVTMSIKNSTAVFSGEVISEEYRDVKEDSLGEPKEAKALFIKLKVKRWWKGNSAEEVELFTSVRKYPNGTTSVMAEDFVFHQGESYLVYAYGPEERLRTDGCKRTRKLADAEDDLLELGEGTAPERKGVGRLLYRSLTRARIALAGDLVAWASPISAGVRRLHGASSWGYNIMKILWYLLTFLLGLFGLLSTIRVFERLVSGAGFLPIQLLIALIMLVLAWLCLRKARAVI